MKSRKNKKNTQRKAVKPYQLTKREKLIREFRITHAMAQKKLKAMNASGLREFNMQYIRKWNSVLAIPEKDGEFRYGTKQGFWRSDVNRMNMKQLNRMIAKMTEFNTNVYNTVSYTEKYVNDIKERTGITNENYLKSMYKVFREYGFAGEYDSGDVLLSISEWYGTMGDSGEDLADWLDAYADAYAEQHQQAVTTDDLKQAILDFNADHWDDDIDSYKSKVDSSEIAKTQKEQARTANWDEIL